MRQGKASQGRAMRQGKTGNPAGKVTSGYLTGKTDLGLTLPPPPLTFPQSFCGPASARGLRPASSAPQEKASWLHSLLRGHDLSSSEVPEPLLITVYGRARGGGAQVWFPRLRCVSDVTGSTYREGSAPPAAAAARHMFAGRLRGVAEGILGGGDSPRLCSPCMPLILTCLEIEVVAR
nr:uncharacterized protein LOC113818942 [Penaeus vannamei]